MRRVGFALPGWMGGVNYLQNLFTALRSLPAPEVQPVLLRGRRQEPPAGFPEVEGVRTALLDAGDPRWFARLLARRALGVDLALDRVLRRHGVALWSHSTYLGRRARVPALGWVEDVQHRHLPRFFGARELRAREAALQLTCRHSRLVVVSSRSAGEDVARFYPEAAGKVRVLRFVDCSASRPEAASPDELRRRYRIEEPFLLLPNQFWAHKNHGVVVEALALLQARGRAPLVLATGKAADDRNPGHYAELLSRVQAAGVADRFRPLGMVPFGDLAGLMRQALAIVNPSLFEGWSTSVEEAKSLGKKVLLSDIPVHREQAPERGLYFDPHDPAGLAGLLEAAGAGADPAAEAAAAARAATLLPARRTAFAEGYQAIVRELLG